MPRIIKGELSKIVWTCAIKTMPIRRQRIVVKGGAQTRVNQSEQRMKK